MANAPEAELRTSWFDPPGTSQLRLLTSRRRGRRPQTEVLRLLGKLRNATGPRTVVITAGPMRRSSSWLIITGFEFRG